MRKTLLQTLLAAFCAILLAAPLEGGGVMLLGARQFFEGGGWKNPYVTDGLIAMWDGEWNAGWGVHDPNATIWKDLAGDHDFLIGSGVVSFLSNCVQFSTTETKQSFYTQQEYGDIVAQAEFVYENCHKTGAATGAVFAHGTATFPTFRAGINGVGFGALGADVTGSVISNDALAHSVSFEKGIYYRIDGGARTNANVSQSNGSGKFTIGNIWGIERGAAGTVYCIRFYSRALTAAEIAANYAVDKARFGLT